MATISEALTIAIQHYQGGRLQAAEQVYRQILVSNPSQPDALHLLGLIAHQMGRHEVAAQYIERAIASRGNVAFFHSNLGEVYRIMGRVSEAVACCRRALELNPDLVQARYNLGSALKDQGKLAEAVACYRHVLELRPDFANAHNNLGVALKDQGKLAEAVACCRRALELEPNFAEAHNNLGVAFKEQGMLADALACYRRALELQPDSAEIHNNLGVALKDQGKLDEAAACCRRALQLNPALAEAQETLGNALKEQGKFEEALACCRRALELRPDSAPAQNNLASALEEIGDFRGAEHSFRAALRCDPRFAAAHFKLAELLGGKLPEEDLAANRRLLEDAELTGEQRALLHFGLARVLDARGEYAEAAEHATAGNALRLAQWTAAGQGYDPEAHSKFVDRVIADFTPQFFARVEGFGLPSERPVFIVGLPRSGTTLLEQILASHSQVFAAGELPLARDAFAAACSNADKPGAAGSALDREGIRKWSRRHLDELQRLNATALRVVDKMPDNYVYLGFLAGLFPRARFIHCRRDLRDVAVSCWMADFRMVRWASAPGTIAARFRDYQRLMEHWRKVLPAAMLEVSYEETVGHLETVARRLVAGCGLPWEPQCLEFHRTQRPVLTASAVQVRQPLFATSVGRWQHYRQSLVPLLAQIPHQQ